MLRLLENHPVLKSAVFLFLKSIAILVGTILTVALIIWVFGDLVQGGIWQGLLIVTVLSCLSLWFLVGRQIPIGISFLQALGSIAMGLSPIMMWALYQFWFSFFSGTEGCAGGAVGAVILGFIGVCGGGTMMALGYVFSPNRQRLGGPAA